MQLLGTYRRVAFGITDVLKERIAFIIWVKRINEVKTTLVVTEARCEETLNKQCSSVASYYYSYP
jgi:hypothetical protein